MQEKSSKQIIITERGNVNLGVDSELISSEFSNKELLITQGFLGSDSNNFTTTLGREGE